MTFLVVLMTFLVVLMTFLVVLMIAGPTDASPSGISSVSNPVVIVEDVAVEGIWLHIAWPQDGRQNHNNHMSWS